MHMMASDHQDQHQQFCLRWNNHSSTLVAVFDSLFSNESLVDVTLFAEGKLLRAHKVVLSACSPYFETIFAETSEKYPIVVLKDVKYDHIKALLDYMYRGQVNISQDQLEPLIQTAQSLKIKGLADGGKEDVEGRNSVPAAFPRHSKAADIPIRMPSPAAPSVDIKPRILENYVATTSNAVSSVLSNALTMPPALSNALAIPPALRIAGPLNLPHLQGIPPSLASTIASSLTTAIPHSICSSLSYQPRHSDCDSPHPKKRRRHRRRSGEGGESGDSDCPSSGSPADSVNNLLLPRIPATITPIAHSQHQQGHSPQHQPRDLSSNSHAHTHNSHKESNRPPLPPPPAAHPHSHRSSSIPLLLPTSQLSHMKPQEYPEDLKHHPEPPLETQHISHYNSLRSVIAAAPLKAHSGNRSNHNDRSRSPFSRSPSLERNCSSRNSRRGDEKHDVQRVSPLSNPETISPARAHSVPRAVDTSSGDNQDSEDESSSGPTERSSERISDFLGPSTSRPHSEEAPPPQSYLNWPYATEASADDTFANLAENSNPDIYRAINFVRSGFPGFLPPRMPAELLTRPAPIGLPLLLKGNNRDKGSPKLMSYSFPTESPKQFSCEKCGRTYASTGNLKRHKKYECGVEPQFSCPVCKKKFQHRHSVKIHIYSTHREEAETIQGEFGIPAGTFSAAGVAASVGPGGPLREEFFALPQEATSGPSHQNQNS